MANFSGTVLNSKLKILIEKVKKTRDIIEQEIASMGVEETNELKNYLEGIKKEIDSIEVVLPKHIKKMRKRLKKRRYLKAMKSFKLNKMKEIAANRQVINNRIDKNLELERNAYQDTHSRYKIIKARNNALAGVNIRITDADNFIKKLISLKKLRQFRKNSQTHLDYNETHFNQTIDQIIAVWVNAKIEYVNEKSLIEETFKSLKSIEDSWCEVLFGESWEIYNKNQEDSIQKFLEIRHRWDTYIVPSSVPEGTPIPIGWVIPEENVLNSWNYYRSDI